MTQAQQMEQDLEETAGDHDDDSSNEDSTAALAALVKIYTDILFLPDSFSEENELISWTLIVSFFLCLFSFSFLFTEVAKALCP